MVIIHKALGVGFLPHLPALAGDAAVLVILSLDPQEGLFCAHKNAFSLFGCVAGPEPRRIWLLCFVLPPLFFGATPSCQLLKHIGFSNTGGITSSSWTVLPLQLGENYVTCP